MVAAACSTELGLQTGLSLLEIMSFSERNAALPVFPDPIHSFRTIRPGAAQAPRSYILRS